jgi:integrase
MAKPKTLSTQSDVFTLPLPAGKAEAWFSDRGKTERRKGLMLRVRGQTRTWVYLYSWAGKRERLTLGLASEMPLASARLTVDDLNRKSKDSGKSPAEIWNAAPVPTARPVTLGETVTKYLAARDPETAKSDNLRMSPRGFVEVKRYLNEYWKPLHRMALGEVTRQHVTSRIDELAAEKGTITADRARTALSGLYAWSMEGDHELSNPVIGSRRHGDNAPRDRTLTDAELVAIWNASVPTTLYGRIVRLLILTGCRRDEIAGLRWSEIHALDAQGAAEIRLPGDRTKNGQPHTVPLSAPAVATLQGIVHVRGREHVFGQGAAGFSGYSRAKAALDAKAGIAEHWTLHDIRRTVRTRLGSLGVQPHIAEAILNHLPPRLIRTYDRNPYGTEKRHALDTWAGYLQTVIAQSDGANVVPLRKA